MTKQKQETLVISPPNMKTILFRIRGTAPYVQHRFSARTRTKMVDDQKAGAQKQKKRKREPKDFEQCYKDAMHVSTDGWYGIPAPAFRNAMISACRIAGFKMTHAKLSVFVEADGLDADDKQPLVRITKGEPTYYEAAARNADLSVDIRARPLWEPGWEAELRIRFDADLFSSTDIANLLARAGLQVGIGEGRPDSKKSAGLGMGLFEIVQETEQ